MFFFNYHIYYILTWFFYKMMYDNYKNLGSVH